MKMQQISRKTVIALLALLIIVSLIGTWTIINTVGARAPVGTPAATSGDVKMMVYNPDLPGEQSSQTGLVHVYVQNPQGG